jgi:hypothetical protein
MGFSQQPQPTGLTMKNEIFQAAAVITSSFVQESSGKPLLDGGLLTKLFVDVYRSLESAAQQIEKEDQKKSPATVQPLKL